MAIFPFKIKELPMKSEISAFLRRVESEIGMILASKKAFSFPTGTGLAVVLPEQGRWLDLQPTVLPGGRQAWHGVEYPGQQSHVGCEWQTLVWLRHRVLS